MFRGLPCSWQARPAHLGHPCTWHAFPRKRDIRCNAMGRTSRTSLVFFLPLVTLLLCALHLTQKVLSLDIDSSQSRDAIRDRSRNNGCGTRHTFPSSPVLFCGVEFLLEENNNLSGEAFLSSLWATLRCAETQEGGEGECPGEDVRGGERMRRRRQVRRGETYPNTLYTTREVMVTAPNRQRAMT